LTGERTVGARLLGAANIVLVVLVMAASEKASKLQPLALVLFLLLVLVAITGLRGVAANIGRRLFRGEGRGEGVGAFVLAWLLISGVSLFPIFGFAWLLWIMAAAVGAVPLASFGGPPAPEPVAEAEQE
jgi:hypothetical protein